MDRIRRIATVSALGAAVAWGTTACAHSSPRDGLTLTNDTASSVTVKDCPPNKAPQCGTAATKALAAEHAAGFPLSSGGVGTTPAVLIITGKDGDIRCLIVPPGVLPQPVRMKVTDATPDACVAGG